MSILEGRNFIPFMELYYQSLIRLIWNSRKYNPSYLNAFTETQIMNQDNYLR